MQISLRMKILLGVALAITAYVMLGPGDEPTVEVVKPGNHIAAARHASQPVSHIGEPARALYSLAHRVSAGTAAAALFAAHSWYTPPPPPPPAPAPVRTEAEEAALRTPVAPPLPFAYIGSYTYDGSAPVFFLTQGDRVYDVKVGDTLGDTYSIDAFTNGQLLMTYKPLKIQQQLQVGSTQ